MNKLNDIFKKVAELEKNAQEVKLGMHVELASIKELQTATDIMKKFEPDVQKIVNVFEQKVNEVNKAFVALRNERNIFYVWANNEAPARIRDFEKAAKALGLEVNNLPEVIALKKEIENTKELIKALDGYKEPNDMF